MSVVRTAKDEPQPQQQQQHHHHHHHHVFITNKIKLNFFQNTQNINVQSMTTESGEPLTQSTVNERSSTGKVNDPDKYDYKIDDLNEVEKEAVYNGDEDDDEDDEEPNSDEDDDESDSANEVQEKAMKHLNEKFLKFKNFNKTLTKFTKKPLTASKSHSGQSVTLPVVPQHTLTTPCKYEMNFLLNPSMNALHLHSKKDFIKSRLQSLCSRDQNGNKKRFKFGPPATTKLVTNEHAGDRLPSVNVNLNRANITEALNYLNSKKQNRLIESLLQASPPSNGTHATATTQQATHNPNLMYIRSQRAQINFIKCLQSLQGDRKPSTLRLPHLFKKPTRVNKNSMSNLDDSDFFTSSTLNNLADESLSKSSGTYKYIATTTSRRIKSTSLTNLQRNNTTVYDATATSAPRHMTNTAKLIAANHRQLEYITSKIKLNLLPSPLSTFYNHDFNYKYFERANNKQ